MASRLKKPELPVKLRTWHIPDLLDHACFTLARHHRTTSTAQPVAWDALRVVAARIVPSPDELDEFAYVGRPPPSSDRLPFRLFDAVSMARSASKTASARVSDRPV